MLWLRCLVDSDVSTRQRRETSQKVEIVCLLRVLAVIIRSGLGTSEQVERQFAPSRQWLAPARVAFLGRRAVFLLSCSPAQPSQPAAHHRCRDILARHVETSPLRAQGPTRIRLLLSPLCMHACGLALRL